MACAIHVLIRVALAMYGSLISMELIQSGMCQSCVDTGGTGHVTWTTTLGTLQKNDGLDLAP